MSKVEVKDKSRKYGKSVVALLIAICVVFILVRIVALNANNGDQTVVQRPDFDSVVVQETKGKMSLFEEQKKKEEEAQFSGSNGDHPKELFLNLGSAFVKDTAGHGSKAVQQASSKPSKKQVQAEEDYYEIVSRKKKESDARIAKNPPVEFDNAKTVPQTEPAPVTVVDNGSKNKNPFGTYYTSSVKKEAPAVKASSKDAYKCLLHADQKVANGGGVIFRAAEDIVLSNRTIKRNSLLYGSANYSGQRVIIKINRVKSPEGEFAINLQVFDNDFVKGVYFKNAYDEAAENSQDDVAEDARQSMGNGVAGTITKSAITIGKNVSTAIKKDRSLHLQEGYIVYVKESTTNE